MNLLDLGKDERFEVPEVSEGGGVHGKRLVRRGGSGRLLLPGEEVEVLAAYCQSGMNRKRRKQGGDERNEKNRI